MGFRSLIDRWTRHQSARFVSIVSLVMVVALAAILFLTNQGGMTSFGSPLGGDYGEFYAVGVILDQGLGSRLYDLDLQDQILHSTLPGLPSGEHLPFAYPPFLASLFQPMAGLSYTWSLVAWLGVSLGLYASSVGLMVRGWPARDRWTAWLLALSFVPFAMECWLGGQLSAIGCLMVAVGLTLDRTGRPFLSGLAFAGLLYKPTLPVLIVPVILASRRWRTFGGFVLGSTLLGITSLIVSGPTVCLQFAGLMLGYGRQGGSIAEGFKTMKYVDLRAFLRLLGFGPRIVGPLAMTVGLPAFIWLAFAASRNRRGLDGRLVLAGALCWTPVVNAYGPVYDVCLAVTGILFVAREPSGNFLAFRGLVALVYVSALFSPALAKGLGFQPLTVALAALGFFLVRESFRREPTAAT